MNMLYDFSSALLQARQRKSVTQEQIAFSLADECTEWLKTLEK